MSWRSDVKNRINQIRNNEVEIVNEFPISDNFAKNNYRKSWVSALFVDICDFTTLCREEDAETIGLVVKTFHDGILDIMKNYDLKHIQIQGDGIFGVVSSPNQNHENSEKIFKCAMDINGYLGYFWNEQKFKISLAMNEELMIIVGKQDEREVVFAGGAVNKAKKLMEKYDKKNCILIDELFANNNTEVLWNEEAHTSYTEDFNDNSGNKYSEWHYLEWKE